MSEEPTAGGYMHVLPMIAQQDFTLRGVISTPLPWGSVGFLGTVGEATDNTPVVVIAYEWPEEFLRVNKRLSKVDIESLHVRRFVTDHIQGVGSVPFTELAVGPNPPDFLVRIGDELLGLECAALAIQERRAVQALFADVRLRVLAAAESLPHLAGWMVYLWFDSTDALALGRPHRRADLPALQQLVDGLFEYRPDPTHSWVMGGPPPVADASMVQRTSAGASFYGIPFIGSMPSTLLAAYAGFELGLAYTTTHRADIAWARVRELVDSHDKPGVDWLLLSAGAPNTLGQVFASEEAVANLLPNFPEPLSPKHIRRITLHLWGSGAAVELYPQVQQLFGPLFRFHTPASRAYIKTQNPRPRGPTSNSRS